MYQFHIPDKAPLWKIVSTMDGRLNSIPLPVTKCINNIYI